jgi:hypothetical protein
MLKFNEKIHIRQPVGEVFAYATDLSNTVQWQGGVVEAEQTSAGPFGIGSTYRIVNQFYGQKIESEGVVSEYEPDRICVFQFTSGPVTGKTRYLFGSADGGTIFTASGELEHSILRFAGWIIGRKAKEQARNDLAKLKQILENGGSPARA